VTALHKFKCGVEARTTNLRIAPPNRFDIACRSAFVIFRNSAFSYKGKAIDVQQVGRELNVGWMVCRAGRHRAWTVIGQ
jgi:hypothetical protein